MAIIIGGTAPVCGICLERAPKGEDMGMVGSVAPCKVDSSKFNESVECPADAIHVSIHAAIMLNETHLLSQYEPSSQNVC